jgi:hypothetical protein
MRQILAIIFAGILALPATGALADSHAPPIIRMLPQLREAIIDDELIRTLRQINQSRKHYTQSDIDLLQTAWTAQIEDPDNYLVANPIAARLREVIADHPGLISQIDVLDSHGISIAQSSSKPEIWFGNDKRWRKTFLAGPNEIYIDDIQFDALSHSLRAWANFSIEDPNSGRAIGAIAIGINVEAIL